MAVACEGAGHPRGANIVQQRGLAEAAGTSSERPVGPPAAEPCEVAESWVPDVLGVAGGEVEVPDAVVVRVELELQAGRQPQK